MSQLESSQLGAASNLHLIAHLTDDQFTDCAIGLEPDATVSRHLDQCELCRNELAAFGSSIDSFNRATQSWSESQPAPSLHAARRPHSAAWVPRPFFAAATWALAACVLFVAAISTIIHHHPASVSPQIATQFPQDSPAQIEQDNKLLMAIDREIRADDRSPAQEYGIGATSNRRSRARGELTNQ